MIRLLFLLYFFGEIVVLSLFVSAESRLILSWLKILIIIILLVSWIMFLAGWNLHFRKVIFIITEHSSITFELGKYICIAIGSRFVNRGELIMVLLPFFSLSHKFYYDCNCLYLL